MDNDYSYIGVPSTTQEVIGNGHHDHPIASSETHTLPDPEVQLEAQPVLSAPMLVGAFLLSITQNLTSWS